MSIAAKEGILEALSRYEKLDAQIEQNLREFDGMLVSVRDQYTSRMLDAKAEAQVRQHVQSTGTLLVECRAFCLSVKWRPFWQVGRKQQLQVARVAVEQVCKLHSKREFGTICRSLCAVRWLDGQQQATRRKRWWAR